MTGLFADIRYALRQLRRNPGFTLVAVVTLALGIGVNTGIFNVVEGVLLARLHYSEPDRENGIPLGITAETEFHCLSAPNLLCTPMAWSRPVPGQGNYRDSS